MFDCCNVDLGKCMCQQIVNVYDNVVFVIDDFFGKIIWMFEQDQSYDIGLIYVFDYGELLGEVNVYFYGFFYVIVFDIQIKVFMVMWMFEGMKSSNNLDF